MPYPPTSVRIRVICGRLFSARGSVSSVLICGRLFSARSFCAFRAFCGNLFPPTDFSLGGYGILPYPRHLLWDILPQNTPNSQNLLLRCPPTDFTDLHRYLGCTVLPQNSQNSQNLAAWVWQGCHTLLICAHPCHLWEALLCQKFLCVPCVLWESFLCKKFCVFGVFRGSFFTACSVGAAETAAPPGGIHGSSVQISPPHHLTTTTSFHLEPSLLHVLPVLWVRLRHHLRLVDAQPGEHDGSRCERHRHAVVVVGVDRL